MEQQRSRWRKRRRRFSANMAAGREQRRPKKVREEEEEAFGFKIPWSVCRHHSQLALTLLLHQQNTGQRDIVSINQTEETPAEVGHKGLFLS